MLPIISVVSVLIMRIHMKKANNPASLSSPTAVVFNWSVAISTEISSDSMEAMLNSNATNHMHSYDIG